MSYFNFKLYTRPIKNVNTDLEFKKIKKTAEITYTFSDITDATGSGVSDFIVRVNTIAPAIFTDITTWYAGANLGTTYEGVFGVPNGRFSLPLPTEYNHISITYNNPHPGSGTDAVYIFIGGVGSGALPAETPGPGQAVDKIVNGTTGASKTYGQFYQAGDYLKIQEKAAVITTALVIKLSHLGPGWAPGYPRKGGRAPILGYRKNLDCSGATGCQNETIYKDNWAKTCAINPLVCYNPVIKTIQNKGGKIDNSYNYTTRNLLRSRFRTYEQNAYNFDISGGSTNWGGGADPANNAYLIHDCSCNVSFTANNPCIATYAPSNRKFAVNNAVSGRSRINRLKYNTITKVKSTKTVPFSLLGYPRGSCEFCKRDFKPSKGRKGGDNKERINSRLPVVGGVFAAAAPAVACCDETLPADVIKLCTGFNSGSNCSGGYTPTTYDTVGYLKNALAVWTNPSGCNDWNNPPTTPPIPPTTGRLGNYTTAGYPDIGTMCPLDALYRGNTIGGFAWNPVDAHLWFILEDVNMFSGGATPSGFQFTAIEFSSSPSFLLADTAKLYASDNAPPNEDYDSGSPYEIHWSSSVTGWAAALSKIINIFGDGSVTKNVYIQFEL